MNIQVKPWSKTQFKFKLSCLLICEGSQEVLFMKLHKGESCCTTQAIFRYQCPSCQTYVWHLFIAEDEEHNEWYVMLLGQTLSVINKSWCTRLTVFIHESPWQSHIYAHRYITMSCKIIICSEIFQWIWLANTAIMC